MRYNFTLLQKEFSLVLAIPVRLLFELPPCITIPERSEQALRIEGTIDELFKPGYSGQRRASFTLKEIARYCKGQDRDKRTRSAKLFEVLDCVQGDKDIAMNAGLDSEFLAISGDRNQGGAERRTSERR